MISAGPPEGRTRSAVGAAWFAGKIPGVPGLVLVASIAWWGAANSVGGWGAANSVGGWGQANSVGEYDGATSVGG
jgi:hypothetical protein